MLTIVEQCSNSQIVSDFPAGVVIEAHILILTVLRNPDCSETSKRSDTITKLILSIEKSNYMVVETMQYGYGHTKSIPLA